MTPEAARFLDKARQCLADAAMYEPVVPRIAGREAYFAAFHAAAALIYERTGKVAKTHRGLRAQFARISKEESRVGQDLSEFLARAYDSNLWPITVLDRRQAFPFRPPRQPSKLPPGS